MEALWTGKQDWNRCTVRPLGIYTATRSSPQTEIPVNIQYPHRIVVKESKRCRNPHNLVPFLWRSTLLV